MEIMEEFCDSRHLLYLSALSKLDENLMNIATGLVAPESVNIIDGKECGANVIKKMEGSSTLTFSFKREHQVKQTLSSSSTSKKENKISIDPELVSTIDHCL